MTSDLCVVRSDVFLKHALKGPHPENPTRLSTIHRFLDESPWIKELPNLFGASATNDELHGVHALEMVNQVLATKGEEGWLDADTYFNPESASVAGLAAGSTLHAAMEIWRGSYRRGFSLVRPPGHHATRETAMGFCLFNSIAVAAKAVLDEKPDAKVAIVDFDLHHGNGTQFIFYDDPRVLFLSSHRFPFYPGTGDLTETGKGSGDGLTVNFPLPQRFGDDFFLELYSRYVLKMLKSYRPDMIFVSAGFDGHALDPMLGFSMTTEGYGRLAEILIGAAEETTGKILFVLEGGYHPEALAASVIKVLEKLRDVPRSPKGTKYLLESPTGEKLLDEFGAFYRPYFPEL